MTIDFDRLSAAERLLWGYGVTEPSHINLDNIAEDRGAEVRYRALEGCEARLVSYGGRAVISVRAASSPGRQRFSLAHELAHWLCDRGRGSFLCAQDDIGPQNAEAKSLEANANSYASQLVLPDYLAKPRIEGQRINLDLASVIAKEFNVSLTAAGIKAIKRTLVPSCIACYGQTGRIWFQRSSTFPADFYLVKELHQDTDAFEMVFGSGKLMSRPRKDPANFWFTGRGVFGRHVEAQSVKISEVAVLTVLSLI